MVSNSLGYTSGSALANDEALTTSSSALERRRPRRNDGVPFVVSDGVDTAAARATT